MGVSDHYCQGQTVTPYTEGIVTHQGSPGRADWLELVSATTLVSVTGWRWLLSYDDDDYCDDDGDDYDDAGEDSDNKDDGDEEEGWRKRTRMTKTTMMMMMRRRTAGRTTTTTRIMMMMTIDYHHHHHHHHHSLSWMLAVSVKHRSVSQKWLAFPCKAFYWPSLDISHWNYWV